MSDERELLKDLLVNETEIIKNLASTIQKVKKIFRIEEKSGKIVFNNYSKLTNPQRICCILMGKYFTNKLGIIEDSTAAVSDLSSELEIPSTTLSSPLKSLRKSGLILYDDSRYKINPHRIEEITNSFFDNLTNDSINKHKDAKI